MASIPLQFVPPDVEDLVALNIYESANSVGPFLKIETVNDIGSYPTYIDNYTTNLAAGEDDWFAVDWEDAKGARTPMSAPIKGGTSTLVSQIVSRVRQRDSSLSLFVVTQEAESAVESYFGKDPYSVSMDDLPDDKTYRILNGITYLAMARSMLSGIVGQSNVSSATIGVVSMKSGEAANARLSDVEGLIDYANELLDLNISLVMLMEEVKIGNSISSYTNDQSRLVLEIGMG